MMTTQQGNPQAVLSAAKPVNAVGGPACRSGFFLRFESLSQPGRTLDFPCDRSGRVDLDGLGEVARSNYLFARAVVGRGYSAPVVVGEQAEREI